MFTTRYICGVCLGQSPADHVPRRCEHCGARFDRGAPVCAELSTYVAVSHGGAEAVERISVAEFYGHVWDVEVREALRTRIEGDGEE